MIAILALLLATAQSPEQCLVVKGDAVATVEHAGKTYRFTSEECAAEFRGDPERFAQLYDALLEMHAQGIAEAPKPQSESLVPS